MPTSSILDVAPAVLFEHMRQQLVSAGRLMSPREVSEAVDDRDDVPKELSGWFLCGDVHSEMYAKMVSSGGKLDHEVVLFPTASGLHFLALSQRVGEWEHRFLLPLVGPMVRDFVRSLHEQPLRMALAASAQEQSVISQIKLARANVVDCVQSVQDINVPVNVMFNEFAAAAVSLVTANTIKERAVAAAPGKVCVSLVASPAIAFALTKLFSLPAEAAMH